MDLPKIGFSLLIYSWLRKIFSFLIDEHLSAEGYDACPGYWDEDLTWHQGTFNPQGWMVEGVLKDIKGR